MIKYTRILFLVLLRILWSYFTFVLPHLWFKHRIPLAVRYAKLQRLVKAIAKTLRIEFLIDHPEVMHEQGPYYFVSDHNSMLDPFLFVLLIDHPTRFIAKKQVAKLMIIGDCTKSIDAIFIDRNNLRQEIKVLQTLKQSLIKKDVNWVIYPEGTRNRQPETAPLNEFKPGSFKLAMDTQSTIVLVPMYGTHRPLNPNIDWKKYPIQIDFMHKITPAMYEGKTTIEVAEMAQRMMQQRIDDMKIKDLALQASRRK